MGCLMCNVCSVRMCIVLNKTLTSHIALKHIFAWEGESKRNENIQRQSKQK
jgi:hypothetical protein